MTLKIGRYCAAIVAEPPAMPQSNSIAKMEGKILRIAWVTRSFLDYRVPVYRALDQLTHGSLYLLYSGDYVPERAQQKVRQHLGERAIALRGEWQIGREDRLYMANRNLSFRFQPGLLKAIRQIQPQVLVCDGFFKWTFPALIYRIVTGTPLVILYERTFHTERKAQWFRTLYRKLVLRFIDAMSCNGRLCRDYSEWLGMPTDRITIGHMAAETEGIALRSKNVSPSQIQGLRAGWATEHGALVLLYVGRLIQSKGLKELIEGWGQFQRRDIASQKTKAVLVIVGNGAEEQNLRQQVYGLHLQNVHFAGAVDYDKLAPYYVAADAFIIPTLEDNWSLVVPEAMACGLPILCSKYNGCWPELVQNDCNGWVFDPLDHEDILRCLRLCMDRDAQDLSAMGAKSKEILKEHTPRKAAEAIFQACKIAKQHIEER